MSESRETRLRDAFVAAMLPSVGQGLPGADELDLRAFWPRFEEAAPRSLSRGFRAATLAIGHLPYVLGYGRALDELGADEREEVLRKAARIPGFDALLDVAKVVVCFAYFNDPGIERIVRGTP